MTSRTTKLREEARRYNDEAHAMETSVSADSSDFRRLLSSEDSETHKYALKAIATVARKTPDEISELVTEIEPFLDSTDDDIRYNALRALGNLSTTAPETIMEDRSEFVASLDAENSQIRHAALNGLRGLAQYNDEAIASNLADILEVLSLPRSSRHAPYIADILDTLSMNATVAETIASHPDEIRQLLSDDVRRSVRIMAAKAIQRAESQADIPEELREAATEILAKEDG